MRGLGPCVLLVLSSSLSAGLARSARAQDEAVVFIAPPGLPTELTDALDEAISAQVSLVGARVVFLKAEDDDAGLEERMTQAEALAREHHAVGAFWLDARPSKRWFLYIMDRNGAHVVVRPLSAESTSLDAAIEAAAVIAGSATDALLKQQPLEGELYAPPPPKAAKPPPPPDEALGLEVGYSGTLFAPGRILHGLWLGVSWRWPSGPYVGLSYVWTPPVQVENGIAFELTRYPIWLQGGARTTLVKGLELAGELAFGVEIRTRVTTHETTKLDATESSTRAIYLASVRVVGEFHLTEWLALVLRVSPELAFNPVDYFQQPKPPEPGNPEPPPPLYLSPYQLQFTAQLGVAIIR